MQRRKQYLYSDCAIPARTLYRRRIRERHLGSTADVQKRGSETLSGERGERPSISSDVDLQEQSFGESSQKDGEREGCQSSGTGVSAPDGLTRTDSGIMDASSADDSASERSLDMSESSNHSGSHDSDTMDGVDESVEGAFTEDSNHDMEDSYDLQDVHGRDEDPQEQAAFLSTPLCDSTTTTEGDALLMCLALGLRHSLSWTAMVDILSMINHLFGREVVKATKYFFLKYMHTSQDDIVYHIYCPNCDRYIGTREDVSNNEVKVCSCGSEVKVSNHPSSYFLSLSLGKQLKTLFEDTVFVSNLNYRFIRRKINQNAYEDLFDGELYKSVSGPGKVLSEKFNISYTFNTDGFPVGGRSGKQTCWPIYIQINELPPKLRSRYMLLAGIYVGKKEPNMQIFMYPFVEEANVLSSAGVNWSLNGKEINSKVIPLCACVDSPARSRLLNMAQFNGHYGCTLCYCKAESLKVGLRYTIPIIGLRERTHEEIIRHAAEAHANRRLIRNKKNRSVKGVRGLTPVHTLHYLDLNRGVRADPMHSKLLGNGKGHTLLLSGMAGKPFYIGSDVLMDAISKRLTSIQPPSSIFRPPRRFQEISLWKASEWRSWVLFYGVICLKDIIPDEYVLHFSMLATALHIILQQSITPEDLEKAHVLLLRYVFLYQQYFGKDHMVYNVHLLLHTKRDVECLGPAWTNTAFAFEGANKGLLQFHKSFSNVALEIARKYMSFKSLPALTEKYGTSENAFNFCERMTGRSLKKISRVGSAVFLGGSVITNLDAEEMAASQQHTQLGTPRVVFSYDRVIYNGIKYCTGTYSSPSFKHDDSYVCIRNKSRGRIQKICSVIDENGSKFVTLFVRELVFAEDPLFDDEYGRHSPIKRIQAEGQLFAAKPEDITTQCVAMLLDHGNFMCDMPFGCYGDS